MKRCRRAYRLRAGCPLTWMLVALLVALSAGRVAGAGSVAVGDAEFSVRHAVGDRVLELRGTAILRWAWVFEVYAGAFYLPRDVPSANWSDDVPKHLELSYFHRITAGDIIESSQHHLASTLAPDLLARLQPRLDRLYGLFRDVGPGDRYGLTYVPASGTVLSLNGKPLGTIEGNDFARAYFGIWLGREPLKEKFRDQILGFAAS